MKNKIYSLFLILSLSASFVACDGDSDVDAIVDVAKPTMTINFPTTVTATEGDIIPISFTLSKPVGKAFSFYIVLDQNNSTANNLDSDIDAGSVNTTFQKVITIPPFVTTYSDVIEINEDELAEGSESLKLIVGESRTSAVNFQPVVSTITISNKISNDLVLTFNFDRPFTGSNGYSNTLCEFVNPALPANQASYDVDFVVYDEFFTPVTYPGNAGAQTGACPEELTMSLNDYPNGLYRITAFLYTNGGLNTFPVVTTEFNIPITVDYVRAGSINKGTFTQLSSNWFTSSTVNGTEQLLVDVVISTVGGVRKFTIQDENATVSATGRFATKAKHVRKN